MKKIKFKLLYVKENGVTSKKIDNVPVTGIMLENKSRISTLFGSTVRRPVMIAEEVKRLAEANDLQVISLQDFLEIRSRQNEIRKMLLNCRSPVVLADEYLWTQDGESGEMMAVSLVNCRILPEGEDAGVLLKYK